MQKARRNRRGFTLIETVVSVGIVAALAAVVYPSVVNQFDSADPTKAAEDLGNIRTAIEVFGVNVRPNQPEDIEDLVNPPDALLATTDVTALGAEYSLLDSLNWNGPYLGLSVNAATATATTIVVTTGFGGQIVNKFPLFDIDDQPATLGGQETGTSANAEFVTIKITGLSGAAFNAINALLDGPTENTASLRRLTGRFRCAGVVVTTDLAACTNAYYFAVALNK